MAKTATLTLDDHDYPLPILTGSEGEKAIDTRGLRAASGYVAYDQGYGNTGSCESSITFLDGDVGVLRHRGYPIEQLAQHSDFVETPVHDRRRLVPGERMTGPLLIEDEGSTLVVGPGAQATVLPSCTIVVTLP